MPFQRSLLASAIMLVTTGVYAESAPRVTLLDQVSVSATRSEQSVGDVAASLSVIDRETLEQQLAGNIQDAVRYEPGVNVSADGRSGFRGFNIRGMNGNRVKIMVDGVNQSQSLDSGFTYLRSQRNLIDMDAMKGIEIVKGPASSLYGSDAIGGLVAFTTKDPADYLEASGDDSYASIKGQYSSVDEGFSHTYTLANRSGDLESLLLYTRRDHSERENYGGANIDGPERGQADPLDASSDNLLAKLQYQLNEAHRVGLTLERLNQQTDIDVRSNFAEGTTGDDKVTRSRVGVFHEWQANNLLFDSSRWQLDWQDSKTEQSTYIPSYTFSMGPFFSITYPNRQKDYEYGEESYEFDAQFDKAFALAGLDHQLIYGVNLSSIEARNKNTNIDLDSGAVDQDNYIPEVDAFSYGLFAQDTLQLTDRWSLTPGVRYDHFKYEPDTNAGYSSKQDDKTGDKVTARLGTVYDLTDELSVFAQFSQGYKAPGLYETYFTLDKPGQYAQRANPNLKPEESDSFELGLRGSNPLGSFEVTGFYNRYDNFIENVALASDPMYPQGVSQYQNISEATIKGAEVRGQLWLDDALGAPAGTTARASLAFADGEGKQSGGKTEPLNSVAPLTAVLGLGYDDPSETWGSELSWTLVKGKSGSDVKSENGEEQFNPSGYGLVDLTAYYKPARNLTLRAGVFNITDREYWLWDDIDGKATDFDGLDRFSQPGRNFSVSATWEI